MAVMVLTSAMGVFAANSKENQVYVSETEGGSYVVETEASKEFASLKTVDADVYALITGFNNKTVTEDKLFAAAPAEVKEAIKGKGLLWKIFDLNDVNGGTPVAGKHAVTLEIPGLTKANTNVKVLHYSEVDKKWEVLESTVDYEKKTVTIVTDDLSPIAIYADGVKDSANGTSPSTGVASTWTVWAVVAIAVMGAGVVVLQRKKY